MKIFRTYKIQIIEVKYLIKIKSFAFQKTPVKRLLTDWENIVEKLTPGGFGLVCGETSVAVFTSQIKIHEKPGTSMLPSMWSCCC